MEKAMKETIYYLVQFSGEYDDFSQETLYSSKDRNKVELVRKKCQNLLSKQFPEISKTGSITYSIEQVEVESPDAPFVCFLYPVKLFSNVTRPFFVIEEPSYPVVQDIDRLHPIPPTGKTVKIAHIYAIDVEDVRKQATALFPDFVEATKDAHLIYKYKDTQKGVFSDK
jgi:hypothetical protein